MSSVKDHYDHHLGNFYSWMVGDFDQRKEEQKAFFISEGIVPKLNKVAIDLGCGHGIQSVALAELNFSVLAIDFNSTLLDQLERREVASIATVNADIKKFDEKVAGPAELIICMGDTLTHLENLADLKSMAAACYRHMLANGKLVLSFRDLSIALQGDQRIIPVRSDETRILTCFLEYFDNRVIVHDILNEKIGSQWQQKVSSYPKLRLPVAVVKEVLTESGFEVLSEQVLNRMVYLIAQKS